MGNTYREAKMVLVKYRPEKIVPGMMYIDIDAPEGRLFVTSEELIKNNEKFFESNAAHLWFDFVKPYIVKTGTIKPGEMMYDENPEKGLDSVRPCLGPNDYYGGGYYKILAYPEQIGVMRDNHADDSELKYFTDIWSDKYVSIIEAIVFECEGKCSIAVRNTSPGFDHNGECLECDAWPSDCECFRVRTAVEYPEYFYKVNEGDENKVVINY